MWDQVLPPSIDLNTPSPIDTLRRILASPVPTQTTSGFDGATATAPKHSVDCWSKTGVQFFPSSVVFHKPPVAAAMYIVLGLFSMTAMSTIRPPLLAGPMLRADRFANTSTASAVFCCALA